MPTQRVLVELNSDCDALRIGREALRSVEEACPGLEFVYLPTYEAFAERISEAHIALCWRFNEDLYARAPRLTAVLTPAAGRDWVAPDPAGRVTVHHCSFHGRMIAESMLAMMLHFNERRTLMMRNQSARRFDRNAQMPRTLLASQRVLFVGYGAIGRRCAALLKALGCTMAGMQRHHQSGSDDTTGVRYCTPDTLAGELPVADHVVVLLPGGEDTRGFCGARELALMKPSAYLYNFGRGTSVDEDALVAALREGTIAGAGLDVFAEEPLPQSSPLWDLDTVLITPHSSCMYREYGTLFAEEIRPLLVSMGRG